MDSRQAELSEYRIREAEDTLRAAENCLEGGFYRDSINRSYYASFYAVKAVLALESVDFKRHKDAVAYFNKEYVATGKFPREIGRNLGTLKQLREKSDYDDFYIVSKEKATEQYEAAKVILQNIKIYLKNER